MYETLDDDAMTLVLDGQAPAPTPAPTPAPPAPTPAPPPGNNPFPVHVGGQGAPEGSTPDLGKPGAATPAPAPATTPAPPAAPTPAPPPAPPYRVDNLLLQILQTKRRHESKGDYAFRQWLAAYLKQKKLTPSVMSGNIVIRVNGKKGAVSKTLFSCHVDTVHSMEVSDILTPQKLVVDSGLEQLFLSPENKGFGHVLGADDGAGIFVLLRMIEAKVPGTYIFHIGEEVGGIGSRAMRKENETFLKQFSRAVAFDRKDTGDVIITQSAGECASMEAGKELAGRLNAAVPGFKYEISHRGSFTDTSVYRDVIPECFNLSCGYEAAHTKDEYLDLVHLYKLTKACTLIDWEGLVVKRDPAYKPPTQRSFAEMEREDNLREMRNYGASGVGTGGGSYRASRAPMPEEEQPATLSTHNIMAFMSEVDLATLIETAHEEPEAVAKALWFVYAKYKGAREEADILGLGYES